MSVSREGMPALGGLACMLATVACGSTYGPGGYDATDLERALDADAGLVLGDFPLRPGAVVDGDTVKVGGLEASLRLLAIDTEETFKSEKDRRAYEAGWEQYLSGKAAKTRRPVKVATPMGEEAKRFAYGFFDGVHSVRLERDHPKELRGRFSRFLTYVLVERDDRWVNYNVEATRAGMSPYFTKYGYSRRFHDDFVDAQNEARRNRVGIWDPKTLHYPDYEERLAWWNARADFVQAFEREAEGRDDYVVLTHWDSMRRLERRIGKVTTVLATVGDVRRSENGPVKVMLSRRMFSDLPVVFLDRFVFEDSRIAEYAGEYVHVRGPVSRWENPHTGSETLQIVVDLASQVTTPPYTPPGSGAIDATEGKKNEKAD